MRSKHDPCDSLADIIDNIERIEQYLAGLERVAFEQDGRTRDASNDASSGFARRLIGSATKLLC